MIVHLDTALNLNLPDNDNRLLTMIICGRDNKICIFIKFLIEKDVFLDFGVKRNFIRNLRQTEFNLFFFQQCIADKVNLTFCLFLW